jgi:hypothetical protein
MATHRAVAIAEAIETYQDLREAIYNAARENDGELMGADRWLRYAMSENSIEFSINIDAEEFVCSGYCYSMQTMSNENFNFYIPFSALKGFNL